MAYAPLSVSPRPANASGRNSDQVNPIGHESPAAIAKRWQGVHDPAYAYRYVQRIMQSADEVFNVISRYAIDCDAEQNGWARAVHGPSAKAEFDAMYKGWNEAGANLTRLERDELSELSGTGPGYSFGSATDMNTAYPDNFRHQGRR